MVLAPTSEPQGLCFPGLVTGSVENALAVKDIRAKLFIEKEYQRFTCKIYLMDEVVLNSVRVQGKDNEFNIVESLKVSALSREIDNNLRKKQLSLFKADKRIREREGIEPDRASFRPRRSSEL